MDCDVSSPQATADGHGRRRAVVSELTRSLVILGCSFRKKQTSRLLPAIDRYDGPVFRVLRRHMRETPDRSPDASILSGRFGLISGEFPIPRYERRVREHNWVQLSSFVEMQLKQTLDNIQPDRVFVSVGCQYWRLIERPLLREVPAAKLVIASGGIGGRASQLAHWLQVGEAGVNHAAVTVPRGEAVLLGTTVQLSPAEVLREARRALLLAPTDAHRFETWYVAVGYERVAPKWLVSVLFNKPVARFRTSDARRVLSNLGVPCLYAGRH